MNYDNIDFELIVKQGKIPLWKLLLSVVFFSIMVWIFSEDVIMFYNYGFNEDTFRAFSKSIGAMAYCLTGGIVFAISKTILIDVDKDLLISRYQVGLFSRDVKANVPKLEYVSVFLDDKHNFQVNLWYIGNKHYKMYEFKNKEDAFIFAELVSAKLNIDLLDATERGNNKWIEKTN
jgi:hypothetical protein